MTHMRVKTPAFVPTFFNAMDKFLHDDFSGISNSGPAVNIIENEQDYSIELMAPGLQKSDFRIALENELLTISFEKAEEKSETSPKFIKKEFTTKSFSRSFTVNEKLNVNEISAKYENGILQVTIPKAEVKEKEVKTISIN